MIVALLRDDSALEDINTASDVIVMNAVCSEQNRIMALDRYVFIF